MSNFTLAPSALFTIPNSLKLLWRDILLIQLTSSSTLRIMSGTENPTTMFDQYIRINYSPIKEYSLLLSFMLWEIGIENQKTNNFFLAYSYKLLLIFLCNSKHPLMAKLYNFFNSSSLILAFWSSKKSIFD